MSIDLDQHGAEENDNGLQRGTARQSLLGAERRTAILSQVQHLDSEDIAKLAGIPVEAVAAAVAKFRAESEIFSVIAPDNVELFPAYQFDTNTGAPRPEVKQVIAAFPKGTSGWALALWFCAPNSYLGGVCPHEHLAVDASAVIRAAKNANAPLDY